MEEQNNKATSYSNSDYKKRALQVSLFTVALIVIDQIIKFLVKMNMAIGDSIKVTDWFYIYFTENPGMAFGWEIFSKNFLTIFRLIASIALIILLVKLLKEQDVKKYKTGFLLTLSAILAGALGNIIDSIFYGQLFSHSYGQVAEFLPKDGGYAPFLQGKVVDMFYFPIIETTWPDWMPFWGGQEFVFFQPIFNFADACISVGAFLLIFCYYKSFGKLFEDNKDHKKEA